MGRWALLALLVGGLTVLFVARTLVARNGTSPRLFEIFDTLTVLASVPLLAVGRRSLTRADWLAGLGLGLVVGATMPFATLFNPYPFFGIVDDPRLHAVIQGSYTALAGLGGLVVMRWGGPVQVRLRAIEWRRALRSLAFGAVVGVPLAVLNVFANSLTQGRGVVWQSPLAAALDALQPGIAEEVIYRFAFLGLLWLVLRRAWPRQAPWLAGGLAILVHSYSHYSDLFVAQPLTALAMGAALGLIWGLPMTVLALRRDLESAIGFHWIQDALRFLAGL